MKQITFSLEDIKKAIEMAQEEAETGIGIYPKYNMNDIIEFVSINKNNMKVYVVTSGIYEMSIDAIFSTLEKAEDYFGDQVNDEYNMEDYDLFEYELDNMDQHTNWKRIHSTHIKNT